jgi:hypothetical protein
LKAIPIFAILAKTEICHGDDHAQRERIPGSGRRSARPLSQPAGADHQAWPDEYERLRARDRRAVRAEDLTDEDIAALEASEMGPGYEHLDAELQAK